MVQKVLMEFYADWCGPCQTMVPIIHQLELKNIENLNILRINIDENPQITATFKIRSVPAFILFVDGMEKWRGAGIFTIRELEGMVSRQDS